MSNKIAKLINCMLTLLHIKRVLNKLKTKQKVEYLLSMVIYLKELIN